MIAISRCPARCPSISGVVSRVSLGIWLAAVSIPLQFASAQARQQFSLQLSAVTMLIKAENQTAIGAGFEPQLRMNRLRAGTGSTFSLGFGGQFTSHTVPGGRVSVRGVFLEPRASFWGGELWTAYWSARAALLRQSGSVSNATNGYALGTGLGTVRSLGARTNLDLGAALLHQSFADGLTPTGRVYRFGGHPAFVARLGINIGFGSDGVGQ